MSCSVEGTLDTQTNVAFRAEAKAISPSLLTFSFFFFLSFLSYFFFLFRAALKAYGVKSEL